LKILFITRATLFKNPGGDTVQISNTKRSLEILNVHVDIKLTNEKIIYSDYDLIHYFNIIRPADILYHIRKSGKPFVISTIYVNYSEFDRNNRKGLSGLIFRYLSKDTIEYIKVLGRLVRNRERMRSYEYILLGQKKATKRIILKSSLLLPNSNNEYRRLSEDYGIKHPFRVIPNAIDDKLFYPYSLEKENEMVICVARIEGLKNQLNLIKAVKNTKYHLYIIGAPSTNQLDYYRICQNEAEENVHFISFLKQDELRKYYSRAKVHVLPSWFETTGLSSLEAAAMGCNIVVTNKGDVKEYFGDMAFYCDPESPDSIRMAIDSAANGESDSRLIKKIKEEYTWSIAAEKTLEAYKISLRIK
jgi:glycosyltransferase involved in cell wall biosynthesis